MKIPEYITNNCNKTKGEVINCDYFIYPECPNTCAYAREIKGTVEVALGIGAIDEEIIKLLKKEITG